MPPVSVWEAWRGIGMLYGDKAIKFADTPITSIADLVLRSPAVGFVKSYFPDTRDQTALDARFAFVHIDCDFYKPFKTFIRVL
jgi:hypothetical protein